jgi:GNAT superfamily N-acetyltransferase
MAYRATIRRATVADADVLAELFDDYRAFYHCRRDRRTARAFLSDRLARNESVVFVADLDRLVGFVQLYPAFSSLSMTRSIVLNDLFVLPHVRRHGLAGSLIDAAIVYACDSGASRIELATQRTNENAMRLYRAKGFVTDDLFVPMSLELGRTTDRDGKA